MLRFFRYFLELVYPSRCPGCGKLIHTGGDLWCWQCQTQVWNPRMIRSSCTEHLSGCYTLTDYAKGMRKCLIDLKFNHKVSSARGFHLFLEKFPWWDSLADFRVAIPVPLSMEHARQRGYNQTDIIFEDWMIKQGKTYLSDGIIKIRNTVPQSQLLRNDRRHNLEHAFHLNRGVSLKGEKVLLLDDIYTTGSTMEAAAKALKMAGASEVTGMVMASKAP